MKFGKRHFRAALVSVCLIAGSVAACAQVRVVTSIKPLHSLVSAVMEGKGTPELIVQGGGSPHTYTLRPSDARALQKAQVVVWMGEKLERFLESPIKALAGKAQVIELADVKGLTLHPVRAGGVWEKHRHSAHKDKHGKGAGHDHGHDKHGHDKHGHGTTDLHLWLDPLNAKLFVREIVATLVKVDPENAAVYKKNASAAEARLDTLNEELKKQLGPVRDRGFVVFHDGFQYFEKRFGLTGAGSISLGDARAPGARRLREIRAKIKNTGAVCVFSEPQFEPRLVRTVVENTIARTGVLDPLGAGIPNGPGLYFTMMRNNARSIISCLAG